MRKILLFIVSLISLISNAQIQNVVIDKTFANNGIFVTPFTAYPEANFSNHYLLPDGKILFTGSKDIGSRVENYLYKLNSDGSLDTSFANSGYINLNTDSTTDVMFNIDNNGLIYVLNSQPANDLLSNNLFKIVRYTPNGLLDSNFGIKGSISIEGLSSKSPFLSKYIGVEILPDGKILFASRDTIFRLNANGFLDYTFGVGGKLFIGESILACKLSHDKILVSSVRLINGIEEGIISRYNSNGTIDTSFGNNGNYFINSGKETFYISFLEDNNHNIIFTASNIQTTPAFSFIGKLNTDGILYPTFGNNGKVDLDPSVVFANLKIDNNNKILFAGAKTYNSNTPNMYFKPYLSRYNTDGTLDTDFNLVGYKEETTEKLLYFDNIIIQPDGKLLAKGSTVTTGTNIDNTFILRYNLVNNLSVSDIDKNINVSVYPNPVLDIANIQVTGEKFEKINLYSLDGKLIKTSTSTRVEMSTFSKGIYIFEIQTDKRIIKKKIVKK